MIVVVVVGLVVVVVDLQYFCDVVVQYQPPVLSTAAACGVGGVEDFTRYLQYFRDAIVQYQR